jgi:hypothetical protein
MDNTDTMRAAGNALLLIDRYLSLKSVLLEELGVTSRKDTVLLQISRLAGIQVNLAVPNLATVPAPLFAHCKSRGGPLPT